MEVQVSGPQDRNDSRPEGETRQEMGNYQIFLSLPYLCLFVLFQFSIPTPYSSNTSLTPNPSSLPLALTHCICDHRPTNYGSGWKYLLPILHLKHFTLDLHLGLRPCPDHQFHLFPLASPPFHTLLPTVNLQTTQILKIYTFPLATG